MHKYKIGLFGFGCVGQGLYEALEKNDRVNAEIVKIGVKNPGKERPLPAELFAYDPREILENDDIDLVVELIDDADKAFSIVKEALKRKKAVVSANKKMVAENLAELIALQKRYETPLLYEGAVCGSIPVIKTLEDYYALEQVKEIKGIFNGSTNYILTQVIEENKSYDEALHAAQVNGFAETDPTLDVEGYDPKYKLGIVLQHTFGIYVHPNDIFNQGIQNITKSDIAFARERDLKIKLLAKATRQGNNISAFVAPHFVSKESPLYHVENEYNAVLVDGDFAAEQLLLGKGAGKLPTGLAVLFDVVSITRGYRYRPSEPAYDLAFEPSTEEVYVSFESNETLDFNAFKHITEKYVGKKTGYVIGQIDIPALKNLLDENNANVIFTSGAKAETEIHKLAYSYEIG